MRDGSKETHQDTQHTTKEAILKGFDLCPPEKSKSQHKEAQNKSICILLGWAGAVMGWSLGNQPYNRWSLI